MALVSRGLEGIVAAETRLSDVRGEEGKLVYAGYNIDELMAGGVTFEEVAYLLWFDRLPNTAQLKEFKEKLAAERELPQGLVDYLKTLPKNAAPMDVIRTAVSALGIYDDRISSNDPMELNRQRALSILGKIGVIAAYYHRIRQGLELPPVRKDLGEAAHFLYLINGKEAGPEAVKTLDIAYVLHADHGFNASTFSARVTISTLSDIYSAITSAIGTLKGPLHGGANEGVIHMLQEIGGVDRVDAWVENKIAQKQKIMGIGHRVYKTLDPRAPHLKAMAIRLTQELGEPKWIEMSERIAKIMLDRKNLNANVDFYSATVYYSLGIPTDLFTPIFAISRAAGWTGHVLE
ncbi:MAG TPA: citrate/2-methylcitrate synthase, partial [Candidatus Methylacidiphilales bacterium]